MTTPMPTPNIPDEVVDTALCCTPLNKSGDEMAMPIDFMRLGSGSDEDMEAARCVMRAALQAALPLLLEQVAWCEPSNPIAGDAFRWPGTDKQERHSEPLYRLKVSNEQ